MKTDQTLVRRWKKTLGLVVAGLLLVGAILVTAPRAQAQTMTIAELQAQVNLLLAQLALIQGNTSSSCYEFNRDLTVGSTGADVSALQNYLKTTDHFPFAIGTTGYFGDVTRGAVAAWQSSNGIIPSVGYFGPLSRARYALLCKPVHLITPIPDDDDDAEDDDDEEDDEDDEDEDDSDDADADSAEDAIDEAIEAISDARDDLEAAEDDGDDIEDAEELLADAEERLEDAQDALEDDEFEDAEDLAQEAIELADDAVDAIEEEEDDADSEVEDSSAVSPVGNNEARADYELEFTVTAFGGSFYIPRSVERDDDPSDGSSGIEYYIQDGTGDVYTGGSESDSLSAEGSSSGDTSAYFKVSDNTSRTFTLHVALDNDGGTAGYYGVQLRAIRFDDNTSAGGEETHSTGLSDHETDTTFVDDENN